MRTLHLIPYSLYTHPVGLLPLYDNRRMKTLPKLLPMNYVLVMTWLAYNNDENDKHGMDSVEPPRPSLAPL